MPPSTLSEEIAMLRDLIHRLHGMIDDCADVKEAARLAESLSRASTCLAALLKAQQQLNENSAAASPLNELLDRAIRDLSKNC